MAKTVPESKFTEWKGLDRISTTIHAMRCIWRELSKDDFGIDGEIEVVVPKADGPGFETLGNIIKVQAKSGSRYVVQDSADAFASPVEKADLEQWSNSRYPVLLIVYHPGDDKLYCREIREYVRSTPNVFQRPWRVVFTKATDEFNDRYFDTVRRHAQVSEPRVSFQQREALFSNLLPVRTAPSMTHASTRFETSEKARRELSGEWPPFCVTGGRLFTFGDLRNPDCVLRALCDNDIESLTEGEWLDADPGREADYLYLLNQLLGKLRWSLGLKYNRDFERTFFPRANPTDLEFRRSWFNARTGKPAPERLVAKYYEYGLNKFWRHLACHLSFTRIGHAWFLRLIPKYFFTTDGERPCEGELVGPYTTKLKAMEHNAQVLNHVLFWGDVLAQGKDYIAYRLDRRMILNIDLLPMSGIANFAIPNDPATYEEKPQPTQLALFRDGTGEDDD